MKHTHLSKVDLEYQQLETTQIFHEVMNSDSSRGTEWNSPKNVALGLSPEHLYMTYKLKGIETNVST